MIVPFYQKKQPQLQAPAIHENPPSALWSAEPSFMGSIVPFCKILCNEQSQFLIPQTGGLSNGLSAIPGIS